METEKVLVALDNRMGNGNLSNNLVKVSLAEWEISQYGMLKE